MSDDDKVVPLQPRAKKQNATPKSLAAEFKHNPMVRMIVRMNTFSRQPMLMRTIPGSARDLDKPRPLNDTDITQMQIYLEDRGFKKAGSNLVRDALMLHAFAHEYSPVRDLIGSLVWDTKPRLDEFFIRYAGVVPVSDDHRRYIVAVTRAFFISIVARVMRPGCKVDCMIVLEGPQGTRKSSLLMVIALDPEWFSDALPHDLSNKDARQHLPGKLIIEMPELSQLRKSEIETVKAFLTAQRDKYRPSFGRFEIDWPRQNVFVGSTNTDDYLQDSTGNRRFWPLRTTEIYPEVAATEIRQVYAEARAAYEADEQWWLDMDTEEIARAEQADRLQMDPWHDRIAAMVALLQPELDGSGRWIKLDRILQALDIKPADQNPGHAMRVKGIITLLGGKRRRRRIDGGNTWFYWFKP